MLAEQLLTFADDFSWEYRQFKIAELIQSAITLLERNAQYNDVQYERDAGPIRTRCNNIIASSKFNTYPATWQRAISESGLARFLPRRVGQLVLTALPSEKRLAALSTELKRYAEESAIALATVQQFIPLARATFGLKRLEIPPSQLGVIIELPRRLFSNQAKDFSQRLEEFADLIAILSEIGSGERHSPLLLFASTSDPSVILATIITVGPPLLALYNDILDALIKTIELRNAMKKLSEVYEPDRLPLIPDIAEKEIRASAEKLVKSYGQGADGARQQELQNALFLQAIKAATAIRAGARLSLALTTEQKTTTQVLGEDGSLETAISTLELTQKLELELTRLASLPALQLENDSAQIE